MARILTVGAAQLGPIARNDSRSSVVKRMIALMEQAGQKGCRLVVFPELALTTFFPRWYMEDQAEIDAFFEAEMPGPETQPLFDAAARLGVGFYLGYGELAEEGGRTHRYNTAVLADESGHIIAKYRKVHLPGHAEHEPQRPFQHLERRYFEPGNLGIPVWRAFGGIVGMCICNDRRWPETFRVLGLQDVELVMVGYNTPMVNGAHPGEPIPLREYQNLLSVQAGAYQNGTWVISVAKAGKEEGVDMFGGTCIVAPTGEIVAKCTSLDDELIVRDCDLDLGRYIKDNIFNFDRYRRIDQYTLITERTGAIPPPE